MAEPTINLTGLKNVYNGLLNRNEYTLAFEIKYGKGLFVFLMFFSDDDKEAKDKLFLLLRRTNTLLEFKLYGNHRNGDFKIYIKDKQKYLMIKELDITKYDGTFDFNHFLENINSAIPNDLSKVDLITNLRKSLPYIKNKIHNIVDESDKTILFGIKKLPEYQHPREKTLRKLYLFLNGEATVIPNLIIELEKRNITLLWTNDTNKKEMNFTEILSQLNTNIV